jgi:hypothetical protein
MDEGRNIPGDLAEPGAGARTRRRGVRRCGRNFIIAFEDKRLKQQAATIGGGSRPDRLPPSSDPVGTPWSKTVHPGGNLTGSVAPRWRRKLQALPRLRQCLPSSTLRTRGRTAPAEYRGRSAAATTAQAGHSEASMHRVSSAYSDRYVRRSTVHLLCRPPLNLVAVIGRQARRLPVRRTARRGRTGRSLMQIVSAHRTPARASAASSARRPPTWPSRGSEVEFATNQRPRQARHPRAAGHDHPRRQAIGS